MRRNPDHVQSFLLAELGTEGNLDGSERLILRGKFLPKTIEGLLRKYIGEINRLTNFFLLCCTVLPNVS